MTRRTSLSIIQDIGIAADPRNLFRGYLAEEYDGVGQYVLVALSRASTSSALPARIAAGDFGGRRKFPAGTPVVLFSHHGSLEILTLGNVNPIFCPLPCPTGCGDSAVETRFNVFAGKPIDQHVGEYEAFSELQGRVEYIYVNCICTISPDDYSGSRAIGGNGPLEEVIDVGRIVTINRIICAQAFGNYLIDDLTLGVANTGTTVYDGDVGGTPTWTITATTTNKFTNRVTDFPKETTSQNHIYTWTFPAVTGRYFRLRWNLSGSGANIFRMREVIGLDTRCFPPAELVAPIIPLDPKRWIFPPSIPTEFASGSHIVTLSGNYFLIPAGIASGESIPSPTLLKGGVIISPTGIASGEVVSSPAVISLNAFQSDTFQGDSFQ